MKIVYTVCTLNRLGQITSLAKSLFRNNNKDYLFIAGLADEINSRINVQDFGYIKFIPLSAINTPDFNEITEQYDVFELSCALKAYFGDFILNTYNPEMVFYFDTDICIYHSLRLLEEALSVHSILITPHYTSPLPDDGKFPLERGVLNAGLYNGGFVGVKNDEEGRAFLQWWKERVRTQGFNDVCNGMMVDQLWLNLVPLFFKKALVFNHPGCNYAYWNMHERNLSKEGNLYVVNGQPLIFFHFSGYRMESPEKISIHQDRYLIGNNQHVKQLISDYRDLLIENNFEQYLSLEPLYGKIVRRREHSLLKRILMNMIGFLGYKLEPLRKI